MNMEKPRMLEESSTTPSKCRIGKEPQAETTGAKGQFPGRLPVPLGPSPRWPTMLPPKEGWKGLVPA